MLRVAVPLSRSSCAGRLLHALSPSPCLAMASSAVACRFSSSGGGGGTLDDDALASLLKRIEHVDTKGKAKRGPSGTATVATTTTTSTSTGNPKQPHSASPEPSRLQKQLNYDDERNLSFRRAQATGNAPAAHSDRGGSPVSRSERNTTTVVSGTSHRGGASTAEATPTSGTKSDKSHEPSSSASNASAPPAAPKAATGPARLTLTTSEAIQEGAPQCFVADASSTPAQGTTTTTTVEPEAQQHHELPPQSGCVAIADIIGRVKVVPRLLDDVEGKNGEYGEIIVAYEIPFSSAMTPPLSAEVECRLYGPELSKFVADVVRLGDVVHVTGHLYPLDGKVIVIALPLGGNVSIVASTVRGA